MWTVRRRPDPDVQLSVKHGPIIVLGLCLAAAGGGPCRADERAIIDDLRAFLAERELGPRQAIAARIEADAAFDRALLSGWLHRAVRFDPMPAGASRVRIAVGPHEEREVLVRLPPGYDAARPWPLLYALHGTGGTAEAFDRHIVDLLGPRADDVIVASPDGYRQVAMEENGPSPVEHIAALHALKGLVHVDSDRVYVTGYSRGGYAAWTLATLHADFFAAAIPLACTYSVLPYADGLWETMLPNTRHLPVLHCFGAEDHLPTLNPGGREIDATIARQNDRLAAMIEELGLANITMVRLPGVGHGGVRPPPEELRAALSARREHAPRTVRHRFRFIGQASASWLEGHRWAGRVWTDDRLPFEPREGESFEATVGRVIHERLGELRGEIDGQMIRVSQRHVADMTLWLMDDMVDWERPLTVMRDETVVFEGKVEPDLLVCLVHAARLRDFDRLRWAGLRIRSAGRARVVTGDMSSAAWPAGE